MQAEASSPAPVGTALLRLLFREHQSRVPTSPLRASGSTSAAGSVGKLRCDEGSLVSVDKCKTPVFLRLLAQRDHSRLRPGVGRRFEKVAVCVGLCRSPWVWRAVALLGDTSGRWPARGSGQSCVVGAICSGPFRNNAAG